MEPTQVYLFTGPLFDKHANEFMRLNYTQLTITEVKVEAKYIAIISKVRSAMCEEIWKSFISISTRT